MKTLQFTLAILIAGSVLAGCKQKPAEEDKKKDKTEQTAEQKKPELVKKWSTDSVLKVPESVYYDNNNDVLYVSSIDGKPTEKDGKGFISKLSPDGEVLNLKWVTGIDAPKGMGVSNGKLYVTNIDEIVEIDIASGEIMNRYPLEGAKFANDIDVNANGVVYASDMNTNVVYKLMQGKTKKWISMDTLKGTNGLYAKKDHLLIGTKGAVVKAGYEKGEKELFISNTGGIDGLKEVGDGYYIKSDWVGHVHLLHPEKDKILLLNTAKDNINAADIEFVKESNMLYVPTFGDNRVMAYKLKR